MKPDGILLGLEARESVKKLYSLFFVPFYMVSIHMAFSGLYLLVFGDVVSFGTLKTHPAYRLINKSQLPMLAFMLLLLYSWLRPVRRYLDDASIELRGRVRRKIERIYPAIGLFFLLSYAMTALFVYLLGGRSSGLFWGTVIPAMLLSFVAQAGIGLAYVDSLIYRMPQLIENLYDKQELLLPRKGLSIPVYIKVSLLVTVCAIIPFIFLNICMDRELPASVYAGVPTNLFIICTVTLLVGLGFIYSGIQKPLEGLIERMRAVARGDFQKTRIYFSDEVANLKAGFNEMVDGLKEREELQDTFGKYLSIEIARELIKNKKVNLGGEDMEAAVMFCDIRNFTPLSEKLSASELVDFLNSYFHFITPPITANKGVINKFMGDAVMAIYTPLLGSEDYAADAVRAAMGMRKALAEFNASGKAPGVVDFGIGIHAGKLVGGNVGTAFRLEYTFIGDTVNIASRLESKTKELNTDILVSGPALEKARASLGKELKFESLGSAALKGKTAPVEIYRVL